MKWVRANTTPRLKGWQSADGRFSITPFFGVPSQLRVQSYTVFDTVTATTFHTLTVSNAKRWAERQVAP